MFGRNIFGRSRGSSRRLCALRLHLGLYRYTATDSLGSLHQGVIEAPSPVEVVQALSQRNLFTLEVERTPGDRLSGESKQKNEIMRCSASKPPNIPHLDALPSKPCSPSPSPKKAWRDLERALYLRQLQVMFSAGIGLHLATEALAEQAHSSHPKLSESLASIPRQLSRGQPIWKALEQSALFRPSQIAALAVGQESGRLETILCRLAEEEEHRWKLRCKVTSKLIYPIFLLVVISLGLLGLGLGMSRTLQHSFPLESIQLTGLQLAWAHLSSGQGFQAGALLFGVLAAALWAGGRSLYGRKAAESLLLSQPFLGPLIGRLQAGALARHLALTLDSGLSLERSLALAQETTDLLTFQERLERIRLDLRQGLTVTESLTRNPIFPADMAALLGAGEATGNLEGSLRTAARYAEFQTECALETAFTALEPLSIALVGILSGLLMLATFSPFYQHLQTL